MVGFDLKLTEWKAHVQDSMDMSTSLITIKVFLLFTQVDKEKMSLMYIRFKFHERRNFYFVLAVYLALWRM